MQIDFPLFLQMLIYIILIVLIIVFIVLGIKLIGMLSKVDKMLDDVQKKINKTDEIFSLIDRATDYASNISDKVVGGIFKLITKVFKKKGNDKNE